MCIFCKQISTASEANVSLKKYSALDGFSPWAASAVPVQSLVQNIWWAVHTSIWVVSWEVFALRGSHTPTMTQCQIISFVKMFWRGPVTCEWVTYDDYFLCELLGHFRAAKMYVTWLQIKSCEVFSPIKAKGQSLLWYKCEQTLLLL